MPLELKIPELALVVLVGASGSGKSTLARRLFKPTEVLSSDTCRGWVSDDDNNQAATADAFDVLHYVARKRLARGLLTVVDATNLRSEDRRPLVQIAREFHCLPVALVVDTPEHLCHERNAARADRNFGPHVIRNQRAAMRRELRGLQREGFRSVWTLRSQEECNEAVLVRQPLWNNLKHERGPFDIVGDVHGCYDELCALLHTLGWQVSQRPGDPEGSCDVQAPVSEDRPRRLVFLGDLVDRGPKSPAVLRLVMQLAASGHAVCVPGNHDVKLVRALQGKKVQVSHGLAESLAQLSNEPAEFVQKAQEFLDGLVSHYVLDGGRLVVAHAGLKESMHGRGSGAVREFALYGETTGETDEYGLPVRHNWAAEYRGKAAVVYGHTPVLEAEWLNNTICLDTGCVFGGALTALRWPESELVSVKAAATYAEPLRPLAPPSERAPLTQQQQHDDMLELDDVIGKRIVDTRLARAVTVRASHAAAALEIMSRFAADPRWLIYLPPTMSPCETAKQGDVLEHPAEAFAYFRSNGVGRVMCEEKHMGSRAVVVVCRDPEVVRRRFGMAEAAEQGLIGTIFTRTGRPFFSDSATEQALLHKVNAGITRAGLWQDLDTDWMCLDCELMPWSAKAQALIREQYASVGVAATVALAQTAETLRQAGVERPAAQALLHSVEQRHAAALQYVQAYRRYCWDVASVDDLRLAPFHLLASEGRVHIGRDHAWHMGTLAKLADPGDPVLMQTACLEVDLSSSLSEQAATTWWEEHTSRGGEGMVVKPLEFVARGSRGVLQPAVKVRGREYLRIIYGPEYVLPANLERLRSRGLASKRSLALREFALGIEALERFVRREPLRRVHECVFAVLALESEPIDPRL